jgi:F420-0:gamma-glutamyl ligase
MRHGTSAVLPTGERVDAWSGIRVAGTDYLRLPLHTRWLTEADDLVLSLKERLRVAQLGDTVAVSEKVVVLLTGRAVDIDTMRPGRLARLLAGHVRCRTDSRGLSVPEKMEYVIRTIGSGRAIAAAVCGAVTRSLGMRGTFYRLAGPIARDIDGGRPPYEHLLFPPLDTSVAQQICADLERALDIGVGIVDLNDYGGSIRAVSEKSLPAATLAAVLGDNPMGQRRRGTPFVIVRAAESLASRRSRSSSPERHDLRRFGEQPSLRSAQQVQARDEHSPDDESDRGQQQQVVAATAVEHRREDPVQ